MARHKRIAVIPVEGRDKNKRFVLTEMDADKAEKWAMRAWLAMARANITIQDEYVGSGWAGLAILSLQAFVSTKFEDVEPLMDEMMTCVEYMPDPKNPEIVRALHSSDIDEVTTRIYLRERIFDLHAGPFIAAVRSKLGLPTANTSEA